MRGTEAVINFHDSSSSQRLFSDRRGQDYYSPSLKRKITEKITGYIRLILSDAASRNIFMFLCLNLSFAFVELFYGIWSNSLGLISDSFHMFFDCTALLAGLVASIITKWRASAKFSYGYVRAETLAGFVNGLFLVFIAFFIFNEAIERFIETPDIHHERLLIVAIAGFIVNLVGIFVFNHGHDPSQSCTHGGHSHSHGPSPSHSHDHFGSNKAVTNSHSHDHGSCSGHDHNHVGHSHDVHDHHSNSHAGHSHGPSSGSGGARSQIMQGVFLHILADALGSVGVIISSILIKMFGWMIADPICSMCIASLIFVSVIPLLKDSVCVLMQRTPNALDNVLPGCIERVVLGDESEKRAFPYAHAFRTLGFWRTLHVVQVVAVSFRVCLGSTEGHTYSKTTTVRWKRNLRFGACLECWTYMNRISGLYAVIIMWATLSSRLRHTIPSNHSPLKIQILDI